jgi:hypothetical protein
MPTPIVKPTPPKLPYELACEEQAIARALGSVDIGNELDKVNTLLKAASEAREAFLERHGYVSKQTGSWEDTEYYEVHPLYICKWENDRTLLLQQWQKGEIPKYAIISY